MAATGEEDGGLGLPSELAIEPGLDCFHCYSVLEDDDDHRPKSVF